VTPEDSLEKALAIRFADREIGRVALTHRSYAFENAVRETNERLEFLGDAVLGLVVTDLAFRSYPDLSEGELAKLRAATVNTLTLAEVARDLGIGELILLGKGEAMSGGRDKSSILADSLEAVIGAVYIDRGQKAASELIVRLFEPRILAYARGEGIRDFKTNLQEVASQEFGGLPEYRVTEKGPDHQKSFTATVYLAGKKRGKGTGRSKKEAEQRAAEQALAMLPSARVRAKGA
jgi:ribonuclease-3